jgi:hypothetical protein
MAYYGHGHRYFRLKIGKFSGYSAPLICVFFLKTDGQLSIE